MGDEVRAQPQRERRDERDTVAAPPTATANERRAATGATSAGTSGRDQSRLIRFIPVDPAVHQQLRELIKYGANAPEPTRSTEPARATQPGRATDHARARFGPAGGAPERHAQPEERTAHERELPPKSAAGAGSTEGKLRGTVPPAAAPHAAVRTARAPQEVTYTAEVSISAVDCARAIHEQAENMMRGIDAMKSNVPLLREHEERLTREGGLLGRAAEYLSFRTKPDPTRWNEVAARYDEAKRLLAAAINVPVTEENAGEIALRFDAAAAALNSATALEERYAHQWANYVGDAAQSAGRLHTASVMTEHLLIALLTGAALQTAMAASAATALNGARGVAAAAEGAGAARAAVSVATGGSRVAQGLQALGRGGPIAQTVHRAVVGGATSGGLHAGAQTLTNARALIDSDARTADARLAALNMREIAQAGIDGAISGIVDGIAYPLGAAIEGHLGVAAGGPHAQRAVQAVLERAITQAAAVGADAMVDGLSAAVLCVIHGGGRDQVVAAMRNAFLTSAAAGTAMRGASHVGSRGGRVDARARTERQAAAVDVNARTERQAAPVDVNARTERQAGAVSQRAARAPEGRVEVMSAAQAQELVGSSRTGVLEVRPRDPDAGGSDVNVEDYTARYWQDSGRVGEPAPAAYRNSEGRTFVFVGADGRAAPPPPLDPARAEQIAGNIRARLAAPPEAPAAPAPPRDPFAQNAVDLRALGVDPTPGAAVDPAAAMRLAASPNNPVLQYSERRGTSNQEQRVEAFTEAYWQASGRIGDPPPAAFVGQNRMVYVYVSASGRAVPPPPLPPASANLIAAGLRSRRPNS